MDVNEIPSMYAEMCLATQEQREKYAEELSMNCDNSQTSGMENKVVQIVNINQYKTISS